MSKTFIAFWIGVFMLILFFWIYFPAISRYRELKFEQERIDREIKALDHKIAELTQERWLLESDKSYLEKVIREQMGLVRPGEVVYKFVEEKIAPPLEEKKVEEKAKKKKEEEKEISLEKRSELKPEEPRPLTEPLPAEAEPTYPRQETR